MKSLGGVIVVFLLLWGCGCDENPTSPQTGTDIPAVRTVYSGRATSDNHTVDIPEITADLPSISVYADVVGPPASLKVQLPIRLGDPPELYWFVVEENHHRVTINNCKNAHYRIVVIK